MSCHVMGIRFHGYLDITDIRNFLISWVSYFTDIRISWIYPTLSNFSIKQYLIQPHVSEPFPIFVLSKTLYNIIKPEHKTKPHFTSFFDIKLLINIFKIFRGKSGPITCLRF